MPSSSTVPSNIPRLPNPSNAPNPSIPAQAAGPSNGGDVRVKNEPSDQNGYASLPALPANFRNDIASQRAAQNLADKYGQSAQSQINQLHSQAGIKQSQGPIMGQQQRPAGAPSNVQLPPMQSEQARREYAERQRQQQAQQMRNAQQIQSQQRQQPPPTQQQPQRPAGLAGTQMDGAAEWDAYVARRRLESADPHKVDATLRRQLEETSLTMEGGGFMSALLSLPPPYRRAHPSHHTQPSSSSTSNTLLSAQVDGPASSTSDDLPESKYKPGLGGEYDEEDVDAITSDLDDPDDNNIGGEEEEEENGQIMVCTYDKVARVKNKWKCTLKDGVLTTGGKE